VPTRFLIALLVALVVAPEANATRYLRLGFDDDTLKWQVRPNGVIGVDRELSARFTRITIPWRRGETRPRPVVQTYVRRAARAGALQQKIVLAVYNRAAEAPTDAALRDQYCTYVSRLLRPLPRLAAVVIWNEANSPRYWPPDAGAAAYEALLARCWDVLHPLRNPLNLIDSTASHYEPALFIQQLGEAYRASGRTQPIVDTFGHNPYPESAAEDPWATHPDSGTIGEGDYEILLEALTRAFAFTAQRVPAANWPRLWYLEDGFQTSVPWVFRQFYTGRENDPDALPAVGGDKSQAVQLRAAISLAYCQPAVGAFFNFELIDEHRLVGWQSGLMWANGTRKPSFAAFQEISAAVAHNTIDCSTVAGAPVISVLPSTP
jgi:hypothetical protein